MTSVDIVQYPRAYVTPHHDEYNMDTKAEKVSTIYMHKHVTVIYSGL